MKTIKILITSLAAILLAACTRNIDTISEYTYLTIQSTEITKTLLGDSEAGGTRKVFWQNGDMISINGVSSNPLSGIAEHSTSATFSFASALTYPYCIVCPASAYKPNNLICFPAVQSCKEGNFDPEAAVFTGYVQESGSQAILKAGCAVIKFSLTASSSATISSVEIAGGNGEQMIGDFSVDYANGTLSATSTADSLKTVVANTSNLVLGANEKEVFVVVPVQTYTKGINVTFKDSEGGQMKKFKLSAAEMTAGKVYSFKTMEYKAEPEYVVNYNGWSNKEVKIKNTHFAFSPDSSTAYTLTYNKARLLGAFNIKTGALKWAFDLSYAATNGAHFAVNPVNGDIIAASDVKLFCIKEDGSERWSVTIPKTTVGVGPAFSPDAKTIYVGLDDKKVYAIKSEDGTVLGSTAALAAKVGAIIVDNTKLFVTSQSTTGYFFDFTDPSDIKQLGTITYSGNGSDVSSASVAPDKNTVYFSSKGYLNCVDLAKMELKKSVAVGTDIVCGSVVTPSGDVAVVNKATAGTIVLFSAGLETKLWDVSPVAYNNNFNYNCPVVDEKGNLYIVDGKGNAWYVRASDGACIKLYTGPQALQNCTGMCGDILFSGGNAAPALVIGKRVPTRRGSGWSGNGGDICCTKCIQWVYPN